MVVSQKSIKRMFLTIRDFFNKQNINVDDEKVYFSFDETIYKIKVLVDVGDLTYTFINYMDGTPLTGNVFLKDLNGNTKNLSLYF